jgi:hypothetical protein
MSNQIVISSGAKVRDLNGVLTGTSGIVSSVPLGAANGVATLDSGGKVPVSQLPSSVVTYLGTWNAATNTPTLVNGTGDAGDMYICNVAGTVNFGAGPVTFAVGDWVLYGSGTWQKSNGQNGTVTSVAVTESGDALTITGSPITTAGTINIGFAGTSGQYVNGAGGLTTFPSLTGFVPYTGATADVDLGSFVLSAGATSSNIVYANGSGSSSGILYLKQGTIAANFTGYNGIYATSTSYGFIADAGASYKLGIFSLASLTNNTARTYTLPDITGTLALLEGTQTFTGVKSFDTGLLLKNGFTPTTSGYLGIGSGTNGINISLGAGGGGSLIFQSTSYTYTFPAATGTLALTSDLSAYLPLAGGTLTGALIGTTASFSGTVSSIVTSGGTSFRVVNSVNSRAWSLVPSTNGAESDLWLYYGGTGTGTKVSFVNNGNVLIGSTTDSGELLQVNGTSKFTGALSGTTGSFASSGGSNTFAINHSSGSGIALNITKGGNGEGLYINKTSGSGNAATIIGTLNATTLVKSGGTSSQYLMADGSVSTLTNPVTGTGTTNTLPKFTGASTIGNSNITDTGSLITLGSNTNVSSGALGIGSSTLTGYALRIQKTLTGATNSRNIWIDAPIASDVTSVAAMFGTSPTTQAASFTLSTLIHYYANQSTLGAGSSVTNQYGFWADSGITGATNNFGFYGNIPSGTNRWNLYMNGTANNYLAGQLLIGTTTTSAFALDVNGTARVIGNLTVGNTTNAWNSGYKVIDISNSGIYNANTTSTYYSTNFFVNNAGNSTYISTGTAAAIGVENGSYVFYNAASGTAGTTLSFNERFRIALTGAATFSSSVSAASFIPTSSTIPTNGMYLSATNTLGFATNGTLDMVLDTNGALGIGSTSLTGFSLLVGKNLTGGTSVRGISQEGFVQSDATIAVYGIRNVTRTATASFTISDYQHFLAVQATLGAGSAITNQYGFVADSTLISGVNNFGFYGNISAAANRWNLYMNGTANNYMAGSLGIGTTSITAKLSIAGTSTGSSQIAATFANLGTTAGSTVRINFLSGEDGTVGRTRAVIEAYSSVANDGGLSFQTRSAGSLADNMRLTGTGQLGVGVLAPNASARLQVDSTTQGFLPPRMTTTQKLAIGTPAAGLMVYDTTLNQMSYYNGTLWINF